MTIIGTRKPVPNDKWSHTKRRQILERLLKGAEICIYQIEAIRKEVQVFKENGYPIESIECDKSICKNERKHLAYYYEWALDYRDMSQINNKIKRK